MKRTLIFTFLVGILLEVRPVYAQEMKFGKYSPWEFELTDVPFEPGSDAVVLEEINTSFFSGVQLHSEIHRRIKVLKESGKSHGDVHLAYYDGKEGIETIQRLRAQIVNRENGIDKVTKLSKSDFFEVDAGNGHKEIRFTFPEVKEGSILEYAYTKLDKAILFVDGWVFQNNIPTIKSSYSLAVPEFLDYRMLGQGFKVVTAKYRIGSSGLYRWNLTDLRSVKAEPYMNHFSDYLEKVQFQLAGYKSQSTNILGQTESDYKNMFSNWQELADFFMERRAFASYTKPDKNVSKSFPVIDTTGKNKSEILQEYYSYVTQNFTYDGKGSIVPDQSLKDMLVNKKGNRAEINLSLMALLNASGIVAHPVMISSKGNGRSDLVAFPFADQFNHLMLVVNTEDKLHFVDACNPDRPLGYLPLDFHVNEGFLLMEKESGLMPVKIGHRSGINQFVEIKSTPNNGFISTVNLRLMDYDALVYGDITQKDALESFKNSILITPDVEVIKFEPSIKTISNRHVLETSIETREKYGEGENVFIKPFAISRWTENPFTADARTFPVDFNYTVNDRYSANIIVPEGYELDDYPENISLTIPDGTLSFSYQTVAMNNNVQVNALLSVKDNFVIAENYPNLKYFMEILTSKLQEPLILQKITINAVAEEVKP
ncbi:DUF3857 domain-containing protein [Lunatibacter salilacus]|uniref:DUF3857 domain-containing protein n=1 Tax=Lunatibacter salilacus TaxID=2483804 RepID=UPI00131DA60E|nr:DUF3857 domain-containing protein [Lunatibacter salilacus]